MDTKNIPLYLDKEAVTSQYLTLVKTGETQKINYLRYSAKISITPNIP